MKRAPKYPRIPHLGTLAYVDSEDRVLGAAERAALLSAPVMVEEKLDGANVVLWFSDDGVLHVASRGGVETRDRGGVLGRLRAWALPRSDELRAALGVDLALYAEWLLARHTVEYSRLPAPLVGLDVLEVGGVGSGGDGSGRGGSGAGDEPHHQATNRFLSIPDRDRVLTAAGLTPPPLIWSGVLGSAEAAERLLGSSAFGDVHAEGIIIRPDEAAAAAVPQPTAIPRIAKLVRPGYKPFNPDEIGGAENRIIDAAGPRQIE